jgi:hypothetical protein
LPLAFARLAKAGTTANTRLVQARPLQNYASLLSCAAATGKLLGTAALIIEVKFIHSCGEVWSIIHSRH